MIRGLSPFRQTSSLDGMYRAKDKADPALTPLQTRPRVLRYDVLVWRMTVGVLRCCGQGNTALLCPSPATYL